MPHSCTHQLMHLTTGPAPAHETSHRAHETPVLTPAPPWDACSAGLDRGDLANFGEFTAQFTVQYMGLRPVKNEPQTAHRTHMNMNPMYLGHMSSQPAREFQLPADLVHLFLGTQALHACAPHSPAHLARELIPHYYFVIHIR